jgi:hypothetical protein
MNIEEYRSKYSDMDESPGWAAIDERLRAIYPTQEPQHLASVPHFAVGGENPLDGISIYRSKAGCCTHLHYVTYGFSTLYYDEDKFGEEFSGFGFELTFRLKPYEEDSEWPSWVGNLLQNMARYVFKSGNWFEPFQYFDALGPIRLDTDTEIVAFAFAQDPELGQIDTPHGEVQFIQAYGITAKELEGIKAGTINISDFLAEVAVTNPLLVTDLSRTGG